MSKGRIFRGGARSYEPIAGRIASRTAWTVCAALVLALVGVWIQAPVVGAAGPPPVPVTPYSGFSPLLSRAPYLSDLTQTSVEVNWAETTSDPNLGQYASLLGYVTWGPAGSSCATYRTPVPNSLPTLVPASDTPPSVTGREFTVGTPPVTEYQSSVELTGLSPGASYCYRVYGYDYVGITKESVDLLHLNPSPQFTTLDPVSTASTAPLTFDVLGDTGEACVTVLPCTGSTPDLINPYEASIDKLIGESGAQFAVQAGDVGYPSGLQTRYGDLQQQGVATINTPTPDSNPDSEEVSNIFGPNYWPQTGGLPTYYADGNHGLDITSLRVWPESATAAASDGLYGDVSYPASATDGTLAASYPGDWYAFSSGNVRIYVLQAAWADGNVGTASGGTCGTTCAAYQVDSDFHWQTISAEYEWLQRDLAEHPGGIKFAVWHYPLRSYSSSQPSDAFLQNSSSNVSAQAAQTSLESLLAQNGVYMAFNAHAHTYQRISPDGSGQIVNYVTGGGGGVLGSVSCSNVTGVASAYALGWDPAASVGSSCGVSGGLATSVPVPTSLAQVYNFLEVQVTGDTVTVTPYNAAGQTFDVQTYQFNTSTPLAPAGAPTGTPEPSAVSLSWPLPANQTLSADPTTASAATSYLVTTYLAGTPTGPPVSTGSADPAYTVTGLTNGEAYTFSVAAVNAQGSSPPSVVSAPIVPAAPPPATYNPVTPYRICDTRSGNPSALSGLDLSQCEGDTMGLGGTMTIQVAGTNPSGTSLGGVPSTATSVVLNVTVTDTTASSYLTVWPAGGARPLSSTVNFEAGQSVPNLVTVGLGSSGQVSLYNANGNADVVVDVEGWMDSTGTSGAPYVSLLSPYRICDTRTGNPSNLSGVNFSQCQSQPLGAAQTLTIQAAGTNPSGTSLGGVPLSGTLAVDLTVTATDPSQASYLTVWPAGEAQPTASNLNFSAGETVANNVVVAVPTSGPNAGEVSIYNANGTSDVVVDVSGYYGTTGGGADFTPMVPYRICDTRASSVSGLDDACTGLTLGEGGSGGTLTLQVAGEGGIPTGVTAVVLNVTVTDTTAPDYLTIYPDGTLRPEVSSLNWGSGETVASGVTATLGSDGEIAFYIPSGQADLVVDVVGWAGP
ncbi:MAG TPA: fibronectin type III domain-containing protein [Candidatus Dormibacteraeota bacterium]|nr:fibronectin type III domain-containing protein [Candidatus Dormibacteraeota bacterium]